MFGSAKMQLGSLYDLITYLEYGTNLHIGVLFFGCYGSPLLDLPRNSTIHTGEVCNYFKSFPKQFDRCFKCRNLAISKALDTKKAFFGQCINGVFEYTHPVVDDDGEVICIIFIGNILPQNHHRIDRRLKNNLNLYGTMEHNFSEGNCQKVAMLIEGYVREILSKTPKVQQSKNLLIENVKKYVDDNLEYNVELSQVALLFHYNEKYLGRLFKKEMGQSFKEYINKARLKKAQDLLDNSNFTVTEIAFRTGYNNVTYFNRVFKRATGLTPTLFRKRNN